MGKILHIVDDEKFIDSAFRVFESAAPGANTYVIFKKGKKLKLIKETPVKVYSPWLFPVYRLFPFLMPRFDMIILHNLNLPKMRYLQCLKRKASVCWIGWGFDYYDLIGRELLKSETKNLPSRKNSFFSLRIIIRIRQKLQYGRVDKKSVISIIDYFSPVIYEDFVLVSNAVPDFNPEFVSWNYGTLEDDLIRGLEGTQVTGPNILLGNSASAPNNHLDAFKLLKALDLGERKIITPLSYGDEYYRNTIINHGNSEFGDCFVPLVEFMPIDEYIKTISSCSIVVMNHLRQQAMGNIVIMLYLGAKVFLDPKNPAYDFLKKQGAAVYSIDELASEMNSSLTPDQIEKNRQVLRNTWSRDVILRKTRELIERLQGRKSTPF